MNVKLIALEKEMYLEDLKAADGQYEDEFEDEEDDEELFNKSDSKQR